MQWYYVRGQERVGPVEDAEFKRMAQAGELSPGTLVWNVTMGPQWVPASTVAGLFTTQQPPPNQSAPPIAVPAPDPATGPRGQTPNKALMAMARESLRNHWGLAIGAVVINVAISMGINSMVPMSAMIIAGPMTIGLCMVFLTLARGQAAEIGQLFHGFRIFGTGLAAYLLVFIFTFLWALLLIVPGIIAAIAYSMTFFIIADNPNVGAREAISRSKEMMRGRKWKFFCLQLRFIGWVVLCLLTCGIGFLWLAPYMQTSIAHFYEDIRPPRQAII